MIYGFGGRIDNDSNAITVIDEENATASTTGYVNGQYVEFSGGGSSDFSTAQVTVINNSDGVEWAYPAIISDPYNLILVDNGEITSDTYLMPLYKGKLLLYTNGLGTVTVSGACEYDDGQFIITGDCTITIS